MPNLNSMQRKVDSLLSVFTKLTETLEDNISSLKSGISENKQKIVSLEEENSTYAHKIDEYERLSCNIKDFIVKG